MTEEIKAILENIKKQNEWEGVEYFRTPLSNEDADKLLDCIINLQQENKAKTHQIEVLEEIVNYERNIRNDKLQQENEKLKYNARSQVNDYFKDKYADEVLKNAELKKENETLKAKLEIGKTCGFCPYYDYKSRCEKAMEHIEESLDILKGDSDIPIVTGNVRNRYLKPVLNILQGSDENEY